MTVTDIIFKVVAGLIAAGGFFGAYRAFKLWQESRAEWTLLVVAGGCIVGVVAGIYSLEYFAILLFLVTGMLVTWSYERKQHRAWTHRLMGVLASLLLVFSLSMILYSSMDCKAVAERDLAVKRTEAYNYAAGLGLGSDVEATFAGGKVLVIAPEDLYTQELVRGLRDGVKTVEIVVQKATIEMTQEEIDAMGGMDDGMLKMDRLEDLVLTHEDAECIISLAGLPWDFATSDFVPTDEQIAFLKKRITTSDAKPLPLAQIVNDNEKEFKNHKSLKPIPPLYVYGGTMVPSVRKLLECGLIRGVLTRRVEYAYDPKEPVPTDMDAAFQKGYILITAGNMASLGEDYQYMLAD